MGKMKNLVIDLNDIITLLARLADDVHDIAEYVRNKQRQENKLIRKQYKETNSKWQKLI